MEIATYRPQYEILFVSGMFAGGWIWSLTHPFVENSLQHVMDEPLCQVGGSIEEISQLVAREIETMEGQLTIVGNSLGSFIGLKIAQQLPERVKQVVISGCAGFGEVRLEGFRLWKDTDRVARRLAELIYHDQRKMIPGFVERVSQTFKDHYRSIIPLIRETNNGSYADEVLRDIRCPVHAIWGENDVITPLADTKSILSQFKIETHVIEECGHSPMLEKPGSFTDRLNCILG